MSAGNHGDINVGITGDNEELDQALTESRGMISRFASVAGAAFLATAAAVTAVVVAGIAVTKAFIDVGAVMEKATTFGSRWEQLQRRFAEIRDEIAERLAPVLDSLAPILEVVGDAALTMGQMWMDNVIPVIEAFGEWIADKKPIIEAFVETVVQGFGMMLYAIVNWKDAAAAALAAFLLVFIKAFEEVKHWLTVAIPAYLKWLGDNWISIFKTMADFVTTVFTNMWDNIKNFFDAFWGLLSGEGFDFEWTGLTEGFENTLKKLPEIAEREKGNLEVALEGIRDEFIDNIFNAGDEARARMQQEQQRSDIVEVGDYGPFEPEYAKKNREARLKRAEQARREREKEEERARKEREKEQSEWMRARERTRAIRARYAEDEETGSAAFESAESLANRIAEAAAQASEAEVLAEAVREGIDGTMTKVNDTIAETSGSLLEGTGKVAEAITGGMELLQLELQRQTAVMHGDKEANEETAENMKDVAENIPGIGALI